MWSHGAEWQGGIVRDAIDETGLLKDQGGHADHFEDRLQKLHQFHVDGVLNDEEYQKAKARILEGQA